ncbi:MAG: hypothetical protein KJ607_11070, partial [Bacteroidetes bacterium]|nr:hypothetical protein [Bacteroidota bacterium]
LLGDEWAPERIIAGTTDSYGSGGTDMYMVKVDGSGDTVWTLTYGTGLDDGATSIADFMPMAKLGWTHIIGGFTYNGADKDAYIIDIDYDGMENREPHIYDGGYGDDEFLGVICPDQGMICAAGYTTTDLGDKDGLLVEYTEGWPGLDTISTERFGGTGDDVFRAADGDMTFIVLAGYTESFGVAGRDIYVALLFSGGEQPKAPEWERTYGGSGDEEANALLYYPGPGYTYILGCTTTGTAGDKDIYLLCLDIAGDTVWTRTIGWAGDEEGLVIAPVRDLYDESFAFMIGGYTTSFGSGDRDGFMIGVIGETGDTLGTRILGSSGVDETVTGIAKGTCTITYSGTSGQDMLLGEIKNPFHYAEAQVQNVTCYGSQDGIGMLNTPWMEAYNYEWSDGPTTGSPDRSGLAPGNYTVTVYDYNYCEAVTSLIITEPDSLQAAVTEIHAGCLYECDKEIVLSISGGIPPYSVTLLPMGKSGIPGGGPLSGLCSDLYDVSVMDSNYCEVILTGIWVPEADSAMYLNLSADNNACHGSCEGIAVAQTSGGTGAFTYQWDDPLLQMTDSAANLCAGLYHVTVADSNFCMLTDSIEITEPGPFYATIIAPSNNPCFHDSIGSAAVQPAGGVAPFTYLWSNECTDSVAADLPAGLYSVTITDFTGCEATASVEILESPEITAAFNVTNVNCSGGSNGAIQTTASGGEPGYSYLWAGGQTTANISGLQAGTYYMTITDLYGCTKADSTEITEPTALSASLVQANVSCNGLNDGTADLTVIGGVTPYSYLWTNGAVTEDVSELVPGTHIVTVTDANNCATATVAIITEPALLQSSVSGADVNCTGNNDGTASVTISGGTAPYTFVWSGGQTDATVSGLTPGGYACTVTDANGCTNTDSIAIGEPDTLTTSIIATDIACYGDNTGAAGLTVAGGLAPFTYLWSGGQTDEDISGMIAGAYFVTVTDLNGCLMTDSVNITEPSELSVDLAITDVTCNSAADGDISLTVNGGTAPYNYIWSGGQTDQDITTLTAGIYGVTITDFNGCTLTADTVITEPEVLEIILNSTDINCAGSADGEASVSVSGGTVPYNYSWSNTSLTDSINGLVAGIYTVTVTDANACSLIDSVTITEPDTLNITVSVSDITCFGDSDGSVGANVSGGTIPYSYFWSTGCTDDSCLASVAGTYSITVTDISGCTVTGSAIVTEPAELTADLTGTDVSCYGGNDGTADLTVNGGTAPYGFEWNNGATSASLNGISAGTYYVTVTDANGCTSEETVVVSQPDSLAAGIVVTDVSCFGESEGQADLTVTGGLTPYTYLWTNLENTEDLTNIPAGSYSVTVTDVMGCTVASSAVILQPPAPLTITLNPTNPACFGYDDGSITTTVSGGTGTVYDYFWGNGATSDALAGISAGLYYITVTDSAGCQAVDSAILTEPDEIMITVTATPAGCGNTDGEAVIQTTAGGVPPYTYAWPDGQTGTTATGLAFGSYTVTVSDTQGCQATAEAFVGNTGNNAVILSVNQILCFGGSGSISADMPSGVAPLTWLWSNGQTNQTATGLTEGAYSVTVTDSIGCQGASDTVISPAPAMLLCYISSSDASCNGCDGEASVTVSGGIPPYYYSWSNDSTGSVLNELCGGTTLYLTTTDANGCLTYSGTMIGGDLPPSLGVTVLWSQEPVAAGDAKIELYTQTQNSDIEMELAFSADNGADGSFLFQDIPAGIYYIRVDLNNESAYPGSMTTYYANTFSWDASTPVNLGCNDSLDLDIHLYMLPQTSGGTGSVSGIIRYNTLKKFIGDPVPGAEVYIEQEPNDDPVNATETDTSGYYVMGGIPFGAGYSLTVDIPGYPLLSTFSGIVLSENHASRTNLNFFVDTAASGGGIFIDSLSSVTTRYFDVFSVRLYPNPFTEVLNIDYTLEEPADIDIGLFDAAGRQISRFAAVAQQRGSYSFPIKPEEFSADGACYVTFRVNSTVYIRKVVRMR